MLPILLKVGEKGLSAVFFILRLRLVVGLHMLDQFKNHC
jgi:hypothetical protein